MTEKEANRLRKIFEQSEIFQYYEKHGDARASSNANLSLRMKYGQAKKMNKGSQKYFRENEEARKRRTFERTKSYNRFISKLKEDGEYDSWVKEKADKFSKWCKDNPEIMKEVASTAGKASLEARRQDHESHIEQCRKAGQKGWASKFNTPEKILEQAIRGSKAAAIVNTQRNEERREKEKKLILSHLPDEFTRLEALELKKKFNVSHAALNEIILDENLFMTYIKPREGGGRGGRQKVFKKVAKTNIN